MSDVKGLTVIFVRELGEEKASELMQIIGYLHGVLEVVPIEANGDDVIIRSQVRHEIRQQLFKALQEI